MQISLEDLKKIADLSKKQFDMKFGFNGVQVGKLTEDQYAELVEIYRGFTEGYTTPEEYFEKVVKGTWIPKKDGDPEKIMV